MPVKVFTHISAAILALAVGGVVTAAPDGRTGPATFDGAALDIALADLNDHLQVKYQQADMLAELDAVPARGFVEVAEAVSETTFDSQEVVVSDFGHAISGGNSLDRHLVAFNEDLQSHGDDLFLQVVRAEVIGFATIASVVKRGPADIFGRERDDPTLDAQMMDVSYGLQEFERRQSRLNPAQPEVTGASFDRYSESLKLLL